MAMKGIDVSKYQGNVDWAKVKASGVKFAIIRAGFGSLATQKDPFFEKNYQGAKAAGLTVGAYWYSYAANETEGKAEAKMFLETIKGKQFEMPVYIDVEDKCQISVGKKKLTEMVEAFCETMEDAGYFVGVYSFTNFFQNYLDVARLSKLYTIWLADFRTMYNRTITRDMHQYTSTGKVNGISGNVDMDNCTKDFPSIMKRTGLNGFGNASAPTATASKLKVGDTVKVKKAIQYDNGKPFRTWFSKYTVQEINGNRVVIAKNGVVVAAVHADNLKRV